MNRFLGALLAVALGLAPQAGAQPQRWNVEETGQPYRDVRVSTTEGTWMSLDVSPDGKTIAFDMLGDIYVIPAAGGEARALHAGRAMQQLGEGQGEQRADLGARPVVANGRVADGHFGHL